MTPDYILQYCLENLQGTVLVESWGEKIEKTKKWLKTLSCPVVYLDGTKPIEENIEYLMKKY